jgi:hypothetical protein
MNINLQQILPKNMSDEAALQLVNFMRNLSVALESIYFDQMLHYTSSDQNKHFTFNSEEDKTNPF